MLEHGPSEIFRYSISLSACHSINEVFADITDRNKEGIDVIIGYTRYGNPIEIDWQNAISDAKFRIYRRFSTPEENYDAWAVLAEFAVRMRRKSMPSIQPLGVERAIQFYFEMISNFDTFEKFERTLSIQNSFDRSRYARTLLCKEFLS